ncbi:MAG: MBL fold metallo-hydrolase [Candidatus Bathyarchaeia archaeon]
MVINNVQVTVLIEDTKNSAKPELEAKHGLSYLVTAKSGKNKVTIMMDTGPSATTLLHNVEQLGVNLQDVDVVVLSHGHYDHTGGLIEALKRMKKHVPVVAHPKSFDPKFAMMPHIRSIGAPCKLSDIENVDGKTVLVAGPVKVADGITTTGEVPRNTAFEKVEGFWTVDNAQLVNDLVVDDQSLVLNVENKGLIVLAGCAHAGIINTIKHAQTITKTSKVYAVLGGFHLLDIDKEKIQKTVEDLKLFDPEFVGPCHCTGKKASKMLAEVFGDRYRLLVTGDVLEL